MRVLFLLLSTLIGCAGRSSGEPAAQPDQGGSPGAEGSSLDSTAPTGKKPAAKAAAKRAEDPLRHRADLPPERRVIVVVEGEERAVDIDAARAAGYTLIDFSDAWSPYIFHTFSDAVDEDGAPQQNRYQSTYRCLADDHCDSDGVPLEEGEKNYLEVFGIPPSMSVIRARFVEDDAKTCYEGVDFELIAKMKGFEYRERTLRKREKAARALKKQLDAEKKKAKVKSFEALIAKKPDLASVVDEYQDLTLQGRVLTQVEARMSCDGHLHKRYHHKSGKLDHGLRLAVRRFQRKHMIYEHTNLRKKTLRWLARPPVDLNFESFKRAFTERVIAATGILEDGTTGEVKWKDKAGHEHVVRDLVTEFTEAALASIQMDTPQKALAFFKRYDDAAFEHLQIGVKLPALPEYYSKKMPLFIHVDRGDVWYDAPWDENGKELNQPRRNLPKLMLYTRYLDQNIRLVRFKTTIGGWREELAPNGYTYFKYKGSDVGSRVIRKIIAGPTWVPPKTTPLKSLAKRRYVNGKTQGVVNYDELGPGYLSAYGLVAGYFVIPRDDERDHDRGIRAHGSSDYMSILSSRRFSHGCHRLMNHKAVRLYGFILSHHGGVSVEGEQMINHHRQFLYKDQVYEIRLPSRGFQFKLTPPLPVEVFEGKIKGTAQEPIKGFIKIPGKAYPDSDPHKRPGEEDNEAEGTPTLENTQ
ncbi:chemotaxis protein CheB [Myxococcota bacterium]|nr:chemotaxis protein CheB [Myxococcota bacterium]